MADLATIRAAWHPSMPPLVEVLRNRVDWRIAVDRAEEDLKAAQRRLDALQEAPALRPEEVLRRFGVWLGEPVYAVERPPTGCYAPSRDPRGVSSKVLVVFVGASSGDPLSRPLVEILTSFGAAYDWALTGETTAGVAQSFARYDFPGDGLYVLTCRWVGEGEDTDFEVVSIEELSDEERAQITDDGGFDAVRHVWAKDWAGVLCAGCKHALEAHTGFDLDCPKAGVSRG